MSFGSDAEGVVSASAGDETTIESRHMGDHSRLNGFHDLKLRACDWQWKLLHFVLNLKTIKNNL
jgi:hypothetical protein